MGTRNDRGFRFPLDKFDDRIALHANFKYLQEYLNYIRKKDRHATQVIIATQGSDSEFMAHFVTDGANDDVQIQQAFDSLPATGGEVVFMDGTYQFDDDVTHSSTNDNIRIVGKGANLSFASGANLKITAQNIYFTGFSITAAGTASATISLSQASGAEWGNVVFIGNHLHDMTAGASIVRASGFQGALFTGNTATDITGGANHAFIFGLVGTGVGGACQVIGNHFENCNMTAAGAGYLARASGSGAEGLFIGNTVENSSFTSLTLASDAMIATHNMVDKVHQTGDHVIAVNDLSDATISGTPADNEVLAYDSGSAEWINQTAAEAGLATDAHTHELDELDATGITDGFLLAADGAGNAEWVTPPQGAAFSELMLIGA